ncbi:MAG: tRNA (adenosine(37)-N6)-threonylcarbamoyltransferase complex ATPase subunit type 1 TsaE [Actinomycetota bacterium]
MTSTPATPCDDADPGAATVRRFRTDGPDDTRRLAAELAELVRDRDVVVLTGDLGAGKTCFTQGLGQGLGIEDRITSPTFTLANRYHGRLTLHHLDVYRLDSIAESIDLGLDELVEDGVTVIEWGDRIDQVLPADHLLIRLRYPEATEDALDRRLIEVVVPAGSDWADREWSVIDRWRQLS